MKASSPNYHQCTNQIRKLYFELQDLKGGVEVAASDVPALRYAMEQTWPVLKKLTYQRKGRLLRWLRG